VSTPLSDEQLAEIRADHFKVVDTFGIGWRIPLDPEVDTFEEDDEPYDRMVVTADSGTRSSQADGTSSSSRPPSRNGSPSGCAMLRSGRTNCSPRWSG